jgi:hypothetical protein
VEGQFKCNGSILVCHPDGRDLGVVAWGFRNPFGLGFDANGQLWATNNGMDERGSRPVEGDPDAMFQINRGDWYGWPDYSIGRPVNQEPFEVDGVIPQLVLAQHPPLSEFAEGFAYFEEHVSANKFDFSSSSDFKFEGDAFVAETGSIPVGTGAPDLRGYRVTRVDMDNGDVSVFLDNRSGQPAFESGEDGINKPIDVKFHPMKNNVMFVVDFGAFLPPDIVEPGSGVVYAIARGNIREALQGIPGAGGAGGEGDENELVQSEPEASSSFNVQASGSQLSFQLPHDSQVSIHVYDLAGRLVRTLADQTMPAGRHEAVWDGLNNQGNRVLSGVYLYRVEAGEMQKSGKIVVTR